MGFETPNFTSYNPIHRVSNAIFGVQDAKFGVIQPQKWGSERHTWRYMG